MRESEKQKNTVVESVFFSHNLHFSLFCLGICHAACSRTFKLNLYNGLLKVFEVGQRGCWVYSTSESLPSFHAKPTVQWLATITATRYINHTFS